MGNPLSDGLRHGRVPLPSVLVIFGATGDLTKRKLVPALYALAADGLLPPGFSIVGAGRSEQSTETFREAMREAVAKYGRVPLREDLWSVFSDGMRYCEFDLDADDGLNDLAENLEELDRERGTSGNRIFYFSIPPSGFAPLAERLGREGLTREEDGGFRRMIIEKPFGRDLDSARELNGKLHLAFGEEQVYRIDHYLGKETVQNLLVFRFGNGIFEPLWNRQYIDHVQITVAENIGVEGRGGYYEESGALRDIIQNHVIQLMAIVGMEAPSKVHGETVRDEKVKLLRAVRPIHPDDALSHTVRGQYAAGWIDGERVPGYREETGVAENSLRETFVAMKVDIDNWRWAGTPFYLRTGKRLPKRATEIAIQFRRVPHSPFGGRVETPAGLLPKDSIDPNLLVLRIQPDEGITLRFSAKVPGQSMRIRTVNMDFLYGSAFLTESPEAYERLLLDCMLGDRTLFAREDEVEEAWRICTAILDGWRSQPPDREGTANYESGTWGPEAARDFMARDGRQWRRL
ncbi:MAG: glucose-6-phosphate dehydrogenase [Candidatus Dormibacteraeota bacterium]|uniref:Glucose-6-phosphate 1-dehydrogenase n=1 Tax=Candidatus Amunia macphersoniae TaxID=3127014 RepID=A0A934KPK0_9BACT|nr:glucose-6-phosphate dehydrogenase [Candidatus Dormibacteraeota bacterium]